MGIGSGGASAEECGVEVDSGVWGGRNSGEVVK